MNYDNNIILMGISGGSGSGKTTFANRLTTQLGSDYSYILNQDSYYLDQSSVLRQNISSVNFDHPSSIDISLLEEHLISLKQGKQIKVPTYNFSTHTRNDEFHLLKPKKIIFIDGILIFSIPQILEKLDYRIFIDCPESLRYERRLSRDVKERGRTPESVKAQFETQVKPMHRKFVHPFKHIACDIVGVSNFDKKCIHWSNLISKKYC